MQSFAFLNKILNSRTLSGSDSYLQLLLIQLDILEIQIIGGWSRSKNGCLGGGKGSLQVLAIHGDNHLEVLLAETLLQVCNTLQAL